MLSPGGDVLARINSRDVEQLLATLRAGLDAWDALPAERRRLPDDLVLTPGQRWEDSCPTDGLVLERISRDLSSDGPRAAPNRFWNRDHVWMNGAEVSGLVPADVAVGSRFALPLLARRLARFHLVDDSHGQTVPFAAAEVERAELWASVTGREGDTLRLELSGTTLCAAGERWLGDDTPWKPSVVHSHGLGAELVGEARWDLRRGRFVAFELVAVARRWGHTQNNGRWRDDEPGLMGFHLSLSNDPRQLAPTFAGEYDADWIVQPAVPTWRDTPEECGLEAEG